MSINRTRVAIFTAKNEPENLEIKINDFMKSYDDNPTAYIEIKEIKHHATSNKWQEHVITVLITYILFKELDS